MSDISTANGNKFTSYITSDGDTLARISYLAWGDATMFDLIIRANFGMPVRAIYGAGVKMRIPIIEIAQTEETNKDLLPPWKRYPTEQEQQAAVSVPFFVNPTSKPTDNSGRSYDSSYDNSYS